MSLKRTLVLCCAGLGLTVVLALAVVLVGMQRIGQQLRGIEYDLASLTYDMASLDVEDELQELGSRLYYIDFYLQQVRDKLR